MVCSGALGFILVFLLYPSLAVDNLQNIINYLDTNYGVDSQYAMAINVPVKYCSNNAGFDRHFLVWDYDNERVRNNMDSAERIYYGHHLIGARPKRIPHSRANYHSEYLLLINSTSARLAHFDPLMRNLLYKDRNGCTVFFTMNSPCVRTCSTPNRPYSIIPALEMFSNHRGPKAFVFQHVWHRDVSTREWENNIRVINNIIPVYRCNNTGCVRCINNNVVDVRCI